MPGLELSTKPLLGPTTFDERCRCGHARLEHKDGPAWGDGRCYRCWCSQFTGREA